VDPDDRPFMFIMDSAHYANGSPRTNCPTLRFLMIVLIWIKYQDLNQTRIKLEAMYDVFLFNKTKSSSQICIDVPVWQEDKTYDNGIFLFWYIELLMRDERPRFTTISNQYCDEFSKSDIIQYRNLLKGVYIRAKNKYVLSKSIEIKETK
jgi:hypothetical protein